jgi:hypothetical protein
MELPRLAAKQKRYRDILRFAEQDLNSSSLKPALLKTLAAYRLALADCWKNQSITPEAAAKIDSIERELDALHNQAHLRTACK